ncbi:MAG: acylphosphatase [Leptospiraceae bacterium]|nr:acylphosphatase [Leptospiraceae bacterium]
MSLPDSNTIQKRYIISGKVQGVGYRMFARKEALKLSMRGQVKNLTSGEVELIAIGSLDDHRKLNSKLQQGPILSRVDEVQVIDEPLSNFSTFDIVH